jgi:hypothetical protein
MCHFNSYCDMDWHPAAMNCTSRIIGISEAWDTANSEDRARRLDFMRFAPVDSLPKIPVSVSVVSSTKPKASEPELEPEPDEPETCSLCENEIDDCTCWTCGSCDRKRDGNTSCSNCSYCESCCECFHCSNCGYVQSSERMCSNCDACRDCCNCNEESGPEGPRCNQRFRIQKPANLLGYRENILRRPVSVELELSHINGGDDSNLIDWAIKTGAGLVADSSITDGQRSCEINSNPMAGDIFLERIRDMALTIENAETDESCGLHVHVDASDYSQFDLRKLIILWAGVESTLYELIARRRWANNYCKVSSEQFVRALLADVPRISAKDGYDSHGMRQHRELNAGQTWGERISQAVYENEGREVKTSGDYKCRKYADSRYHGLNLHSFFFRKTVEVRLFEGTTDADTLENWPLVCGHIVDYAFKHTERQLLDLLRSRESGHTILLSILPKAQQKWVKAKLNARMIARESFGTTDDTNQFLAKIDAHRTKLAQGKLWQESPKARERKRVRKIKPPEFPSMFMPSWVQSLTIGGNQ